MLTCSYLNKSSWLMLFGTSFLTTLYAWVFIHHQAIEILPLALIHILLIPLAWVMSIQGILLCQPVATLLVATIASLHPSYLLQQNPSYLSFEGIIILLFFLGLSLHTFNFSWAILPRNVIETTLLYAPEMGFVSTQYDILIDEIGYNSWYAAYRLPWLVGIGICWGMLMTLSWISFLYGIVLTGFYYCLSSSRAKALTKIIALYLPATFIFTLYSFCIKAPIIARPMIIMPDFYALIYKIILLISPALSIWKTTTQAWHVQVFLLTCIGFDIFCFFGLLGICFLLLKKEYTLSQASKVMPFYIITILIAMMSDEIGLLPPFVWMSHALMLLLGILFWHNRAKKVWPLCFSE